MGSLHVFVVLTSESLKAHSYMSEQMISFLIWSRVILAVYSSAATALTAVTCSGLVGLDGVVSASPCPDCS